MRRVDFQSNKMDLIDTINTIPEENKLCSSEVFKLSQKILFSK